MDNTIACMKIIETVIIELGKKAELEEGDDESDKNTTKNLSSEIELESKKNTKALVWKYFGFEMDTSGGMFLFQKWKKMVDLFSSTFGCFLLCDILFQFLDGNSSFSYIVTKIYNKVPKLDGSFHPLLE